MAGAAELALGDAARAAVAGHLAAVMSDVRAAFAAATVDVQCLRAECDGLAEDLAGRGGGGGRGVAALRHDIITLIV